MGAEEYDGVPQQVPDPAPEPRWDGLPPEERVRFGGMKVGATFFGWLAATGTMVLLGTLLAAVGLGLGAASRVPLAAAGEAAARGWASGWGGVLVALGILLVAFYSGGYVAGRMARFDGGRQGFGVWLWAVFAALLVTGLAWLAGVQAETLSLFNGMPPLPEGVTAGAVLGVAAAAAVALGGAVLGGLAGMHFHRTVDKAAEADVVEVDAAGVPPAAGGGDGAAPDSTVEDGWPFGTEAGGSETRRA